MCMQYNSDWLGFERVAAEELTILSDNGGEIAESRIDLEFCSPDKLDGGLEPGFLSDS